MTVTGQNRSWAPLLARLATRMPPCERASGKLNLPIYLFLVIYHNFLLALIGLRAPPPWWRVLVEVLCDVSVMV